jgi:hypothetical protein
MLKKYVRKKKARRKQTNKQTFFCLCVMIRRFFSSFFSLLLLSGSGRCRANDSVGFRTVHSHSHKRVSLKGIPLSTNPLLVFFFSFSRDPFASHFLFHFFFPSLLLTSLLSPLIFFLLLSLLFLPVCSFSSSLTFLIARSVTKLHQDGQHVQYSTNFSTLTYLCVVTVCYLVGNVVSDSDFEKGNSFGTRKYHHSIHQNCQGKKRRGRRRVKEVEGRGGGRRRSKKKMK